MMENVMTSGLVFLIIKEVFETDLALLSALFEHLLSVFPAFRP
jgi:hypothetical protein